jgi:nucleotide-binding universal stress UspA family protein
MRVLVAVDHSEDSTQMLKAIGSAAWPSGTAVLVVFAVGYGLLPPPAFTWTGMSFGFEEFEHTVNDEAEALVARAAAMIRRKEWTVETAVRMGDARSVIVREAKRWAADLVVMGSGDTTGLKRLHSHSVAKYVVAHAPCSVEVIRTKPVGHVEPAAAA